MLAPPESLRNTSSTGMRVLRITGFSKHHRRVGLDPAWHRASTADCGNRRRFSGISTLSCGPNRAGAGLANSFGLDPGSRVTRATGYEPLFPQPDGGV